MSPTHLTEHDLAPHSEEPDESTTTFRKRMALIFAIVGAVLVIPLVLLVIYSWPVSPADALSRTRQAEAALDSALTRNDPAAAQTWTNEYERCILRFEKAVVRGVANKNIPPAQLLTYKGELLRHNAMLLRDSVFAASLVSRHPIPDTSDASTGEKFRSFLLPIEGVQSEAISRLRKAAELVPEDVDLVTQALRTELMLRPIQWGSVKTLAESTLKSRPDDARALYLLARIEFEQPTPDDPTKSTAPNKRNSSRIRKSLEYLGELKKNAHYPPWRVAYLEAKIYGWTIDDAQRRGDEATARTARNSLQAMLWGNAGMIERAQKGDGLSGPLSSWDVEGILGMFERAVALASLNPAPAERATEVVRANHEFVKFSEPRTGRNDEALSVDIVSTWMMNVLVQSDKLLVGPARSEWSTLLEAFRDRWQSEMKKGEIAPTVVASFVDECRLESRRQRPKAPAKAQVLETQAGEWIDASLRTSAERNLSASSQAPIQAAAAYGKIVAGAPRAAVTEHLRSLAACPEPTLRAIGNVLDAFSLVKIGALEQAGEKLDTVQRALEPDRTLPAYLLRSDIFAGTGNSDRILPHLRQLMLMIEEQPDRFSTSDRVWLADLAPDLDRIRFLMAEAHLEIARDRHDRELHKNPGQQPRNDGHVDEASELAKKLAVGSPYRLYLNQMDAICALALGQRSRAKFVVEALRTQPDEQLAAVCLDVALAFPPGNGSRQYADELEADFRAKLAKEAGDGPSRLGLVLILARTGRADEAVQQLEKLPSRPELKGDQILVEQIDILFRLAQQTDRPGLWKTLRPLFAASLKRYPLEPRSALAIGAADAALGNVDPAQRELQRAVNLAGCRNIRFLPTDRERFIADAQRALGHLQRN